METQNIGDEKVCIAILIPTFHKGGAEKQSLLLAEMLSARFRVIYCILFGDNGKECNLDSLRKHPDVEIVRLRGSMLKKIFRLKRIFKENRVRCLFNYLSLPNLVGGLAGRMAGVPGIYGGVRSSRLSWWKLPAEIFAARLLSTGTIFNSRCGEKYFAERGFGSRRNIVIHNTIRPVECRDRSYAKDGVFTLVTVARFVPEKDYHTSLLTVREAVRLCPGRQIRYIMVGYGPCEQEIREDIRSLGLEETVQIVLNPPNPGEFLASGDIYLSTSTFEGTSNSIMEAMNYALPVVATDVGDNGVLVEDGKSGYICGIGDWRRMAERIAEIITEGQTASLGNASRNRLETLFSEAEFVESYQKLI